MSLKPLRSFALVGVLLAWIPTGAHAGPLVQRGLERAAPGLRTFGRHVEWLGALQSVLPANWRLTVAPGVRSSAEVSWAPGETWFEVLTRISNQIPATVLVDWHRERVLLRPQTPTERATWRKSSEKPAATQSFAAVPKGVSLSPPMQRAVARTSRSVPTSTVRACPTAMMEVRDRLNVPQREVAPNILGENPVAKPAKSFGSAQGGPQAFYGVSVRVPLEAVARHYGLTLRYEALDYPLPGPLTLLLQGDLPVDIGLLRRALGQSVPLSITEYRADKLLVVQDAESSSFTVLNHYPHPKPSLFARLFHWGRTAAASQVPAAVGSSATPSAPQAPKSADSAATIAASPATLPQELPPPVGVGQPEGITLNAVRAPFGPLFTQVARANGFAVAASAAVDLTQPVTVDLHDVAVVPGLRDIAAKAGCVVVIDRATHVVTVLPVSALGAFSESAGSGN